MKRDLAKALDDLESEMLSEAPDGEEIAKLNYDGTSITDHVNALFEDIEADAEQELWEAQSELEEAEWAQEDKVSDLRSDMMGRADPETVPLPPKEWHQARAVVDRHREAQLGDDLLPRAPIADMIKCLREIRDIAERAPGDAEIMALRMDRIVLKVAAVLACHGRE